LIFSRKQFKHLCLHFVQWALKFLMQLTFIHRRHRLLH